MIKIKGKHVLRKKVQSIYFLDYLCCQIYGSEPSPCDKCLKMYLAIRGAPTGLIITVRPFGQCKEATKCKFCFCKVRMRGPLMFQIFIGSQLFLLFLHLSHSWGDSFSTVPDGNEKELTPKQPAALWLQHLTRKWGIKIKGKLMLPEGSIELQRPQATALITTLLMVYGSLPISPVLPRNYIPGPRELLCSHFFLFFFFPSQT